MGLFFFWISDSRTEWNRQLYDVTIAIQGKEVNTTALYDTGNCLRKGLDRQPVSLLESSVLKAFGEVPLLRCKPGIILYHSVGGDGKMVTIQADYMVIRKKRKRKKIVHPCIGIYPGRLTNSGDYEMLLHPSHLNH